MAPVAPVVMPASVTSKKRGWNFRAEKSISSAALRVARDVPGVAGEAETGDVGGGAGAVEQRQARALGVRALHLHQRGLEAGLVEPLELEGVHQRAAAERLGEDQAVAGARALIREQAVRIAVADHREPELELLVADRVAAQNRGASRGAGSRAAGEDARQDLGRSVGREAAEVEREERAPAHGVDVRDRVGRGDAAEALRIVADRRNEVGRRNERLAAEEHHAGVVEGLRSDEHACLGIGEGDRPTSAASPRCRREWCAGRPGRSSRRTRRRKRPATAGRDWLQLGRVGHLQPPAAGGA